MGEGREINRREMKDRTGGGGEGKSGRKKVSGVRRR